MPFSLPEAVGRVAPGGGDATAATFASRQHGLVTIAQLRYAGLSRSAVAHRVAGGRLFGVHRGVYLVGHTARTELTTLAAAVLAIGPGALISHASAALLWELIESHRGPVHVTVPRASARVRPLIVVHRMAALDKQDLRVRAGLPVSSPAATILDLAETWSPVEVERALNEARQRRLVRQGELDSLIARSPGRRGLKILVPLLRSQTNNDFSRKEAERILWGLIRQADLPTPRRNVRVSGFELDFFWPELRLNVETDGYQWHSARHRLNADRDRDATLAANGVQVLRFSWDQLKRPQQVLARLSAAIALAMDRESRRRAGAP